MELKVNEITALEPVKFNYEQLKQEISTKVEKYKSIVYTEDNIKEAKSDRANLNKLAKALNDEKIRVKNTVLTPYLPFEKQCNELIDLVREASIHADTQIKNYEQKAKEEKKKEIESYFNENVGKYKDLIKFDTIFNERWLNATTSMKSIQDEITHIFAKAGTDVGVLNAQLKEENIINQATDFYFRNIANPSVLSLSLQEGLRIIENNKKLEELRKNEMQKKEDLKAKLIKQMSDEANRVIGITPEDKKLAENFIDRAVERDATQQELLTIDFRATATKAQFQLLKEFLVKSNIKYGKVPEKVLEEKELVLNFYDNEEDEYHSQEISCETEKINFSVHNLWECPEDAIIGRDLFDADDYIRALELGMELARKGYTKIKINEIKESEE